MWDLLRGIEPESPALGGGFFTTEPSGKFHNSLLDVYSSSIKSKVSLLISLSHCFKGKKRETGKSKGKMELGNLQNFLGRMFLKCRFRMGTWTVPGFQHEHLATPTLVNTADWLSLALAHLPGTVKHRKADKLPASFTFSFLFFIFISLPYSDDGWEWEFLLHTVAETVSLFLFLF